jgi:putative ABC transport system permease protein
MDILNTIKLAWSGLTTNKGRSFLTMLGIIIGVASVIIIVSVGEGAQSLIYDQIKSLGSNLVAVLPGQGGDKGPPASAYGIVITTLKYEDALAFVEGPNAIPHLSAVAAFEMGNETISYGGKQETAVSYNGTMASYPVVIERTIASGRFFNTSEEKGLAKVIVLGYTVKKNLFGDTDPVGAMVKMGNEKFKVIGYFAYKGTVAFQDLDDQVYIPISTAMKVMTGNNYVNRISAKVDDSQYIGQVMDEMRTTLRLRHKIKNAADDDFTVVSADQALAAISGVTDAIKFVLAAVAAISLLVGGVGIMNTMYVIVKERTREIGLRKAIGAKPSRIRNQFLVESIFITVCGGTVGIVLGMAVTAVVAVVIQSLGYYWELSFSVNAMATGFLVSMVIGVIFGYFPAKRASLLPAIEALRYE